MSNSGAPLLALRDVSLSLSRKISLFGDHQHWVLQNVDVDLIRGETLGLVGMNGSGKSTLLRVMAGIIAPTRGEVIVSGEVSRAVLALGLGFRVDLSGRDNAYLSTILKGLTPDQARACLDDIKEFSELGAAFEDPVKTYSSGMRARLGFSTALISHVDILFIDEVLSVGDGHFRKKAMDAIKEKMKGDQTVVFVSHSLPQVRELCDRVVWLEKGRVRQIGETRATLAAYKAAL